jgi:hypothetical protein
MEAPTLTQPQPSAHALHKEAVQFMMTLVVACQERGGYTLDEAVQLQKAVQHLRENSSATHEASHVRCVAKLLLKSQSQGRLTLEEAWTTFNALSLVCPETAGKAYKDK